MDYGYKVGDLVRVIYGELNFVGEIRVYDVNGTFFDPGKPQVDVLYKEQNVLYKHIPIECIQLVNE